MKNIKLNKKIFVLLGDEVVANKIEEKFKIIYTPCDKKADLFMLQQLSAEGFDAPAPAGSTIRYDVYYYNN